ncbi:MAG: hypothetical protein NC394_07470 [Bacteroides sp.]|nr:hypothetical protein [Bacteroides sp.]
MYCKKCGNSMPDYAAVCDKCGTKVEGKGAPSKSGSNKMIFIPIGIGVAAIAAVVIILTVVLGGSKKPDSELPAGTLAPAVTTTAAETAAAETTESKEAVNNQGSVVSGGNTLNTNAGSTVRIPDELGITVNNVSVPVIQAGYTDDPAVVNDGSEGNAAGDAVLMLCWGENDKYMLMALVRLEKSLTAADAEYSGGEGEKVGIIIIGFDKTRGVMLTGVTGEEGVMAISNQNVKLNAVTSGLPAKLSISASMYDENNSAYNISFGGKFDYFSGTAWIEGFTDDYSEALSRCMGVTEETSAAQTETEPPQSSEAPQTTSSAPQTSPAPAEPERIFVGKDSYLKDTEYIVLRDKDLTNEDIQNLKYFTKLTGVDLTGNPRVTDVSVLAGQPELKSLWLENTGVSDISVLAGCKKIEEFGIKYTKVKDISVVSNFTKMKNFGAGYCQISDISPLASCPELFEVWLSYNPITDFSPLARLNKLGTVGLDNCCEMTWDILETMYGISFTIELNISGNGITDEMADVLSYNVYSEEGSFYY